MPAILFELWNPYIAGDGSLTFEITRADTFRIHLGTREFVDEALRALRLEVGAYSWSLAAGRSLYYSDDPQALDWRNRWSLTWQLKIVPETPLEPREQHLFGESTSLGSGDSSTPDLQDDGDPANSAAFLIIDFKLPRSKVETLARAAWPEGELGAMPPLQLRELSNDLRQLQLTITGLQLPAEVPTLEAFLATLKEAGGAINWRERLDWLAEPAPAPTSEMAAWMASLGFPPKKI